VVLLDVIYSYDAQLTDPVTKPASNLLYDPADKRHLFAHPSSETIPNSAVVVDASMNWVRPGVRFLVARDGVVTGLWMYTQPESQAAYNLTLTDTATAQMIAWCQLLVPYTDMRQWLSCEPQLTTAAPVYKNAQYVVSVYISWGRYSVQNMAAEPTPLAQDMLSVVGSYSRPCSLNTWSANCEYSAAYNVEMASATNPLLDISYHPILCPEGQRDSTVDSSMCVPVQCASHERRDDATDQCVACDGGSRQNQYDETLCVLERCGVSDWRNTTTDTCIPCGTGMRQWSLDDSKCVPTTCAHPTTRNTTTDACDACVEGHYGPACTACPAVERGICNDGIWGDGSMSCNTTVSFAFNCATDGTLICASGQDVVEFRHYIGSGNTYYDTNECPIGYFAERPISTYTTVEGELKSVVKWCQPYSATTFFSYPVYPDGCGSTARTLQVTEEIAEDFVGTRHGYIVDRPYHACRIDERIPFQNPGQVYSAVTFAAGRIVTRVQFVGNYEVGPDLYPLRQDLVWDAYQLSGTPRAIAVGLGGELDECVELASHATLCTNEFTNGVQHAYYHGVGGLFDCACDTAYALNPSTGGCDAGCATSGISYPYCNTTNSRYVASGTMFCDYDGNGCTCSPPYTQNATDGESCQACFDAKAYGSKCLACPTLHPMQHAVCDAGFFGTGAVRCKEGLVNTTTPGGAYGEWQCDCPPDAIGVGRYCNQTCPDCPVETSVCTGGVNAEEGQCECRTDLGFQRVMPSMDCDCAEGRFGNECQFECPSCGPHQRCDDGWLGTGQCYCSPGYRNSTGQEQGLALAYHSCDCLHPLAYGPQCDSGWCPFNCHLPPNTVCSAGVNGTGLACVTDLFAPISSNITSYGCGCANTLAYGSNCTETCDCPDNEVCDAGVTGMGCVCHAGQSRTTQGQCECSDPLHFGAMCASTCSCVPTEVCDGGLAGQGCVSTCLDGEVAGTLNPDRCVPAACEAPWVRNNTTELCEYPVAVWQPPSSSSEPSAQRNATVQQTLDVDGSAIFDVAAFETQFVNETRSVLGDPAAPINVNHVSTTPGPVVVNFTVRLSAAQVLQQFAEAYASGDVRLDPATFPLFSRTQYIFTAPDPLPPSDLPQFQQWDAAARCNVSSNCRSIEPVLHPSVCYNGLCGCALHSAGTCDPLSMSVSVSPDVQCVGGTSLPGLQQYADVCQSTRTTLDAIVYDKTNCTHRDPRAVNIFPLRRYCQAPYASLDQTTFRAVFGDPLGSATEQRLMFVVNSARDIDILRNPTPLEPVVTLEAYVSNLYDGREPTRSQVWAQLQYAELLDARTVVLLRLTFLDAIEGQHDRYYHGGVWHYHSCGRRAYAYWNATLQEAQCACQLWHREDPHHPGDCIAACEDRERVGVQCERRADDACLQQLLNDPNAAFLRADQAACSVVCKAGHWFAGYACLPLPEVDIREWLQDALRRGIGGGGGSTQLSDAGVALIVVSSVLSSLALAGAAYQWFGYRVVQTIGKRLTKARV
jgi:hypothetical protein